MHDPIVTAHEINSPLAPVLLSVEKQQDGIRHVPAHSHPQGQLLGTFTGLATVGIGERLQQWVVPAIHAVWIPPNMPHSSLSHGPFHGWSVFVDEQACARLPAIPRTFRASRLLREAVGRAATWRRQVLGGAELRLVEVIFDEICNLPEEPLGLPMPSDNRILRIATQFLGDLTSQSTLEEWAAWTSIAPRTLTRLFVEETGFNFGEWRQQARLMRALEMLARGEPVTRIAIDLGYENLSAFIAMFKKRFGVTPGKFSI
ncbi:helix-turn-helix transcriptional regulator [Pseudomonas sp. 1912-s]|uniref:AraC family transcriptional regulator n=1 Tax=Pseudomonas sp. 1912-s TaxID=3033802 RepID=UPI0023DFF43F|nr:helix-turn-helix transcriptional regulator [Pseudomonas sp. 1912-s]MDF3201804.1 helix-turn-helix transcriptional regulator [Pseudomonas sp. 1912-s]